MDYKRARRAAQAHIYCLCAGPFERRSLVPLVAKLYFLDEVEIPWLLALSTAGVLFEYAQAVLPAKNKTNGLHTGLALAMWFSMILLVFFAIVLVPESAFAKLLSGLVYLWLLAMLVRAYF